MTAMNRLTDMELDFISLVPAGDDPLARVVIAKAAPVDEEDDDKEDEIVDDAEAAEEAEEDEIEDVDSDEEPEMSDEEDEEEDEDVKKSADSVIDNDKREETGPDSFKLTKDDLEKTEENMGTISKSDLAPEVVAYVEALEDETSLLYAQVEKGETEINQREDQISKLQAELDELKASMTPEDVEKSAIEKADPVIRELLEKQAAELEEFKEIAKAEREARLEREYISKAAALPMITADTASFGGFLRRAADALTPEDNEMLEKIFKAANAQITAGALFDTIGTEGAEVTIEKSLEAMANEIVKANPGMTMEQAITKIYEQNPELAEAALNGEDA